MKLSPCLIFFRWQNREDVVAYMLLCEDANNFSLFREPEPAEDEKLKWVQKYEKDFKKEMNMAEQRLREKNEAAAKRKAKKAAEAAAAAAAGGGGTAAGPSSSGAGMPPPAAVPKKRAKRKSPKAKTPPPPPPPQNPPTA